MLGCAVECYWPRNVLLPNLPRRSLEKHPQTNVVGNDLFLLPLAALAVVGVDHSVDALDVGHVPLMARLELLHWYPILFSYHWGHDLSFESTGVWKKMVSILQMTLSDAFSWLKRFKSFNEILFQWFANCLIDKVLALSHSIPEQILTLMPSQGCIEFNTLVHNNQIEDHDFETTIIEFQGAIWI